MLYWNIERELVEGEPLFLGQIKQFQQPNLPKSTTSKINAQMLGKVELAKVSSAEYQRQNT